MSMPLPFDAMLQADYHMARALAYGLVMEVDVTTYALTGLTMGKEFDQWPVFKRLLERVLQGHNFTDLVHQQTEQGWPELLIERPIQVGD